MTSLVMVSHLSDMIDAIYSIRNIYYEIIYLLLAVNLLSWYALLTSLLGTIFYESSITQAESWTGANAIDASTGTLG